VQRLCCAVLRALRCAVLCCAVYCAVRYAYSVALLVPVLRCAMLCCAVLCGARPFGRIQQVAEILRTLCATSACGNLGLSPASNAVDVHHTALLLLLLMLNH